MKFFKKSKTFGELEAEVMGVLWHRGDASVRDVLEELRKKRKIAYTTVMTVMSRLHEKGILRRKLDASGAYIYTPSRDKKTFFEQMSRRAITNLIREFGDVAVAQFIDVLEENNTKKIKEWKKKLKKIR